MKTHVAKRIAKGLHHNYKVPYDLAFEVANKSSLGNLHKLIRMKIEEFLNCHGHKVSLPSYLVSSLTKRILGSFKEEYARLILDRQLINWLCKNRIDLSQIDGELRNALYEKMND